MRRRRILLIFLALALFAGLGGAGYFLKTKHAVATYRQQLINAGELLTVKELWPPTIPEAENGAALFLQAMAVFPYHGKDLFETNPPQAMTLLTNGRAIVRWRQPLLLSREFPYSTNSWDDLEHELNRYAKGLAVLESIGAKRTIDFNYDYQQGFEGLLPNLAPMKRTTQVLSYATIAALHAGDAAAAQSHLCTMTAFIRANQDERLAISQLVRFAIAQIAATTVWEYLQAPQLSDAALAELQRSWLELQFIRPTENALLMERAVSEMTLKDMRNSRAEFRKVASGYGFVARGGPGPAANLVDAVKNAANETWEGTVQTSREVTWRVAWSYPDQLRMLQGQQILIAALRQFQTNQNYTLTLAWQQDSLKRLKLNEVEDEELNWLRDDMDLSRFFSSGVRSLQRVITKVMQAESQRTLVVTAIALKRHELQHGKIPQSLGELVPKFLPAIPIDPGDGQPLRYKLQADGRFVLYAIGKDGRDDGGSTLPENPQSRARSWINTKDIVWPWPVSAAELEAVEKDARDGNDSNTLKDPN